MIKVIYNKVCGRCVQSEPLTSGMVGQPIELEYSPDFEGLTLTANTDRITDVSYTAKYNELLGAVFVRIYGTISADLNAGYDYDIFTIGSRVPDSNAALSVKCAKNAMALAKTSSNGSAIQISPLESGIKGYDVYITGFWFV